MEQFFSWKRTNGITPLQAIKMFWQDKMSACFAHTYAHYIPSSLLCVVFHLTRQYPTLTSTQPPALPLSNLIVTTCIEDCLLNWYLTIVSLILITGTNPIFFLWISFLNRINFWSSERTSSGFIPAWRQSLYRQLWHRRRFFGVTVQQSLFLQLNWGIFEFCGQILYFNIMVVISFIRCLQYSRSKLFMKCYFKFLSWSLNLWIHCSRYKRALNEHCEFNSFMVKGKNINNLFLWNL